MIRLVRRVALAALFSATMLAAQEPQDPTPRPPELEATQLDARAAAVKELPNLSDGDRTAAAQSYARAIETARTGDGDARKAAGFATDRARAGQRLEETRSELARQLPPVRPEPPQAATVADLEQLAAGFAEAARTAASRLRDAEDALALRAERLPKLPRLIATARERVNAALAKLETPELQGATSEPAMARRVEAIAERYAARQRLAALEAEMAWHDGSDGLLTALRDLAARDAARADELATKWQELVTARRTSEARAAEQSAAQAAAAAKDQQRHPLIVALAEGNEELARKRTAATTELGDINEREAATNARRKAIEDDYQDVTRRVKAVGLTDAMGALLRDRRASLPDLRSTRRRVQMRQQRLASLQIERFDLDNQHQQLKDPEYVPRLLRQAEPPIAANDAAAAAVADLVAARIETVEALRADDGKLFDALIRVDTADQKLMATVETYAEFINERVLWIRSTTPIWSPRLRELGEALTWLSDGSNWTAAADTFLEDLQLDPMPWVFVLLFLLALLVLQPRVRAALTTVGTHAERASTVSFAPTGAALAMTLLIALPLPTAMWLIGWRLQQPFHADFARALGAAFADAGWLLFGLALFRQVVRAKGLGESHFQWPQSSLTFFRRQLRWQLPLMTALVFALSLIGVGGNANWREALTRPLLLVLLGAMTMFFWRMLHPRNGVAGLSRADAPDWAKRFRIVWFVLGAGIPAALFLLAALGYHFTSKQLAFQLGETIAVVTALFLLHDVSLRALVLTRRKLAMAQAAERRKAAAAAAATASDGGDAPQPVEEQLVDVRSIADQTRSLVRSLLGFAIAVGAWLIWVDVLPALGVFKTVVVWDGITLADALLASIVFVMTVLAARNLPGLLQLTILQRLDIHAGERHAIATVARYLVILIGALFGFSTLGLEWSKLQWLAAGISVGLGFGLQEVFANFVSGLIILFERPVRIGDLVTVNGIDGYVTRIQMRATTIRDYNRKELIIPNKEFITGSVVNWTLSDSITRLMINVGVAYGSDTALVREILLEIAAKEKSALASPKPKVVFRKFGESSLDFELRVFTPETDVWPEVIDRINREIDRRFREAGIEIAFPQRDLHIRSAKPIVEALQASRLRLEKGGVEVDDERSEDPQAPQQP